MTFGVAIVSLIATTVVVHLSGAGHVGPHSEIAEGLRIFLRPLSAALTPLVVAVAVVVLVIVTAVLSIVVVVLVLVMAVIVTAVLLIGVVGIGVIVATVENTELVAGKSQFRM